MPFHTLVWNEDVVTATLTELDGIADGIIDRRGARFIPPMNMNLIAMSLMATNLQRARLNGATVRQINPHFLRPFIAALLPGDDPEVVDMRNKPFPLKPFEEISLEAIHNAGVNQRVSAVGWLADQLMPAAVGEIRTVRATSTTAAVAFAWTQLTYTLDTDLPVGEYEVIGATVQSANGVAFRFTFDGQFLRPGGLCVNTLVQREWEPQRNGGLGRWGRFNLTILPRLEIFATVADAAMDIYMDLVKVR